MGKKKAKAAKKKAKKKPSKYDKKIVIKGTFSSVLKAMVQPKKTD